VYSALKKCFISIVVISLSINSLNGQIRSSKKPKFNLAPKTALTQMKILPKQNNKYLLDNEQNNNKTGPHQIGTTIDVNFNLNNSGKWVELDNGGRIWTLSIFSESAKGINLIYNEFDLPYGAELNLYSKTKHQHLGSYTAKNNKDTNIMATQPIIGDTIILELYEPKKARNLSKLSISKAIHHYKESFLTTKTTINYESSGYCNIDVSCSEGDNWTAEIKSTAMFQIGNGYCSGILINNTSNNKEQYFLTAKHCINESSNLLGSTIFYFNWQLENCDSETMPIYNTVVGAEEIFNDTRTDIALLKITTPIPESYNINYSGWDNTDLNHTSTTVLHHPKGDVKKISSDNSQPNTSEMILFDGMTENAVWEVVWDSGTTESGSSGSGLYNQNFHLIGHLIGGAASCIDQNLPDYFGKLSISWQLGLNTYLDPLNLNLSSINTTDRIANSYDINLDGNVNKEDLTSLIDIVTNTSISSSLDSSFNSYSTATVANILDLIQTLNNAE